MVVFFFKQKTAYEMRISDWSSDVCSSDLVANSVPQTATVQRADAKFTATYDGAPQFTAIEGTQLSVAKNSPAPVFRVSPTSYVALSNGVWRSEERRVGKACVSPCRSRGSPDH